tara:strand:+ start:4679 stop:4915 length:237 start_codon:yes stop_codon:yes gene_type:complete
MAVEIRAIASLKGKRFVGQWSDARKPITVLLRGGWQVIGVTRSFAKPGDLGGAFLDDSDFAQLLPVIAIESRNDEDDQ